MGSFLSITKEQKQEQLKVCGYADETAMYKAVPKEALLLDALKLDKGMSEFETSKKIHALAAKNTVYKHIFRGAGAYKHFIPAIVKSVTSREEFMTAYTPYQPEISQGVLQSIFEYQTMMCELTGMDVSNASVYDGATAAAEAVLMCCERSRKTVLISETINPDVAKVILTYCGGRDIKTVTVPQNGGVTDTAELERLLDDEAACFYMQYPNYYGIIEDAQEIEKLVHKGGAKLIMGCNPTALSVLKAPGELGADIAVGEGQPLGLPLGFGGPYLGFMTATKDMMRKLPGRIVGETTDSLGERCFVLTLQAREQHIRREKAGSNICSNEALCAMTAAAYMAAMGAEGMTRAANLCAGGARYLCEQLEKLGFKKAYDKPFFHEFVTDCPVDAGVLERELSIRGILSGLVLPENKILWCVTECNSREDIDELCRSIKEVAGV